MIRPFATEFGLFLTPFVVYALFLMATRAGIVDPQAWTLRRVAGLIIASLILMAGSFIVLAQFGGCTAGLDLRARAYRERQIRAANDAVTSAPHLGDAPWLQRGDVARLLALLNSDGEEARVVGGAVRNALLRLPVDEIDVATTALPDEVMRRVGAAGGKAIPTGIEHGTVTAVLDQRAVEITTLREDVETYGRRARVVFGRDWKRDAERRDFTINALSVTADGKVHDYVGGLADIAAHRVRFIGEPRRRIEEDYLRILRFFRFHAHFGEGAPDAAGVHACIAARAGLEALSRERVRVEMLKLVVAARATPTLAVMTECGLLGTVLGGVAYLASFENMIKVETALGVEADAVRRLGALGVWVPEDAERLAQRLRLSNAESERLLGARQVVVRRGRDRCARRPRPALSARSASLH